MNYAIIAAGGRGKRFQTHIPKQLLPLRGRPVLGWTLRAFQLEHAIDEILVTYPQDDPETQRRYHEVLEQEKITKARLVVGGEERYHSVQNAFRAIVLAADADLVLIHDAARPLVSAVLLRRLIEAGREKGAVIPVWPVHETLKQVEHDRIVRTIPRQHMFVAQTPQVFRYGMLKSAYASVEASPAITDEAILVEKAGFEVMTVPGERRNIKVTEPADLELAEYYLGQGCEG